MIDFLTGAPYWLILVVVLINALIVYGLKIEIHEDLDDFENPELHDENID